jgi:hypothetical protein
MIQRLLLRRASCVSRRLSSLAAHVNESTDIDAPMSMTASRSDIETGKKLRLDSFISLRVQVFTITLFPTFLSFGSRRPER